MSIKKYRALLETIESGSLTRAAERLNYTQPGISHMILSLEDEFGFELLVRGKNGVAPTAEAERLMPYVRQIVNGEQKLMEEVDRIHGADVGTLRIGCFFSLSIHFLPSIVAEFTELHPGIELQLFVGEHGEICRWLNQGKIDLAFMSLPVPGEFSFIPLFNDPIYAVLPQGHPLAERERIKPRELLEYPFILQQQGSDEDANRVFEGENLKPMLRFRVRGDEAIQSMIAKGLGVSLVPELVLSRRPDGLVLKPLEPEYRRVLGIALPGSGEGTPALQKLLDFVEEYCGRKSEKGGA